MSNFNPFAGLPIEDIKEAGKQAYLERVAREMEPRLFALQVESYRALTGLDEQSAEEQLRTICNRTKLSAATVIQFMALGWLNHEAVLGK